MITRVQTYSASSTASGSGDGRVVIIPKTDFIFDGRNNGAKTEIPLAICVDTTDWVSAVLLVRFHTKGTWSATASAEIAIQNVLYAPDDPSVLFTELATNPDIATVTIAQTGFDTAPRLYKASLTAPFGPQVRVVLRWVQGATAATGGQAFAISVELVGRDA